MNVLFITLVQFDSLQERNIYTDLLREFVKNFHNVFVISPIEKKQNQRTYLIKEKHARILRLKIGNIQKTNIIEKGISTLRIESQYKNAIENFFSKVKFDLVLYSTPPITFVSAIEYIKKRDNAKTYLLLKDIFPQNAVDIGLLKTNGIKGILYKYFRKQEKRLYQISDKIGCMSPANVEYVVKHNSKVKPDKVEICPNCIEVIDKSADEDSRKAIRNKYRIPIDKKIFVYGGNLGKPQGIPFLIECLKKCEDLKDVFFLIIGDGTEYRVIRNFLKSSKQKNIRLMQRLPKEDYDNVVGACDVGMIFLDCHFTIPNFPSRLLTYLQAKIPVLAATDNCTDLGDIIVNGNFGWWCSSKNPDFFYEIIHKIRDTELKQLGSNGFEFLKNNYSSDLGYEKIIKSVRND